MNIQPTWKPFDGPPSTPRRALPDSAFAFPAERAEPLTDAAHVRSAVSRFDQVGRVTDRERDVAFANILAAADYYGVALREKNWHEIGGG
jgi:hypothetical protein